MHFILVCQTIFGYFFLIHFYFDLKLTWYASKLFMLSETNSVRSNKKMQNFPIDPDCKNCPIFATSCAESMHFLQWGSMGKFIVLSNSAEISFHYFPSPNFCNVMCQKWVIFLPLGSMGNFFIFCPTRLKFRFWLHKNIQAYHLSFSEK